MCAIIVVLQLMFPRDSLNNIVNLLSLCKKMKTPGLFKETTFFFGRILHHKMCFHSHACMVHVDKKYAPVIDHT